MVIVWYGPTYTTVVACCQFILFQFELLNIILKRQLGKFEAAP